MGKITVYILEELALFLFPFLLFQYKKKHQWSVITAISFIQVISSIFIRQYLEASYSVFIIMAIATILLYFYLKSWAYAFLFLSVGYTLHIGIQATILYLLSMKLNTPINNIVADVNMELYIPTATSIISFVVMLIIYKLKLKINLPKLNEYPKLEKQTNLLICIFSALGLILVIQTVTWYLSSQTTILGIFGQVGLLLVFILMIRNFKLIQEHQKLEEQKLYLENTSKHISEIEDITSEFYDQMKTIQEMLTLQNKTNIHNYLEMLLKERKFIATSIEIYEPMLRSFLQKERHICQSMGIKFTVEVSGINYITPSSISAYQLNQVLQKISKAIMNGFKEYSIVNREMNLKIVSETTLVKFIFSSSSVINLSTETIKSIRFLGAKVNVNENEKNVILEFKKE